MAYRGWDREGMLGAGSTEDSQQHNHCTASSFTPINHNRTLLPPSSRLDSVGRRLEGNYLYELRDETIPQVHAEVSKKRKPLPNGRVVSLGRVWEYEDEEDTQNNGVSLEESVPKRKKTTIANRSQSMKTPSTNNATWEYDYVGATGNDGGLQKDPASQLTTPSRSGKGKKAISGRLAPKSKSKQMPPFENPAITKPSTVLEKGTAPQRSTSIIIHQGWKSTEESVKSTSIVLTKTTMEKLASFRYTPLSEPMLTDASHPLPQNLHPEKVADGLPPQIFQDTSDYDLASGDNLFDGAPWAVKARKTFNSNTQIQTEFHAEHSPVQVSSNQNLEPRQPTSGSGVLQSGEDESSKVPSSDESVSSAHPPPSSEHPVESDEHTADTYPQTSSDSRALDHISAVDGIVEIPAQVVVVFGDPPSTQPVVPQTHSNEADSTGKKPNKVADEPKSPIDKIVSICISDRLRSIESNRPDDSSTFLDRSEIQDTEVCQVSPMDLDAPSSFQHLGFELPKQQQLSTAQRMFAGHKMEVEVECSDIDEPEMASNEAAQELWGSDEFDEGLNDDDLLAIVSDVVVPQTPVKAQQQLRKEPRVNSRFLLPSALAGPHSHARDLLLLQSPKHKNIVNPSSQSAPDLDDEYPLDDGDEEEMLKMTDPGVGVQESFAPPESVQQAFEDLANREVYDSSLQYSPPKSQTSGHSPSMVTQGHHSENARASQSPSLRKDSLLVGEEEDWSFIRSDADAQTETMSGPLYNPQAGAARIPKQPQTLPWTPSRPSIADEASIQAPTTPKTADSNWSIIDDSHEYEPMSPFARPDFPTLVLDRSPVVGFSAQTFLRTCFRIGELFKEGVHRASRNQDAVIELFARVTFSSRETGSTKQHFQFADLWHDRPPIPNGLLANYKTTKLTESESKVFVSENGKMARCLGRFKRDLKNSTWLLHIINIRATDWEEIRWTKEIVSHGRGKI